MADDVFDCVRLISSPFAGRNTSDALALRNITDRQGIVGRTRSLCLMASLDAQVIRTPAGDPGVGVAIFDEHFRYVALNSIAARMSGIPLEEHFGRQVRDIVGPISRRIEAAFERVLEKGQPLLDFEIIAKLPGRKRVGHWIATYLPTRDSKGNVRGVGALVVELNNSDKAKTVSVSNGYFAASNETLDCLGRSEREIQERGRELLRPHRADIEPRHPHPMFRSNFSLAVSPILGVRQFDPVSPRFEIKHNGNRDKLS